MKTMQGYFTKPHPIMPFIGLMDFSPEDWEANQNNEMNEMDGAGMGNDGGENGGGLFFGGGGGGEVNDGGIAGISSSGNTSTDADEQGGITVRDQDGNVTTTYSTSDTYTVTPEGPFEQDDNTDLANSSTATIYTVAVNNQASANANNNANSTDSPSLLSITIGVLGGADNVGTAAAVTQQGLVSSGTINEASELSQDLTYGSKLLGGAGYAGGVLGLAMSYNTYQNNHDVGQFATSITGIGGSMAITAFAGGPAGAFVGLMYQINMANQSQYGWMIQNGYWQPQIHYH